MPYISPEAIAKKAAAAYPRFLKEWIAGNGEMFFPYRIRTRLAVDPNDAAGTIADSQKLMAKSKEQRGWGYSVLRQQVRLRDFGNNLVPVSISIDTRDDLLRLGGKEIEFSATSEVVQRVRAEFPELNTWLNANVNSLHKFAPEIDGLVEVARFFINNPQPDCYARQIPVAVDTKFIERNKSVLRQWLDLLLPAAAIDVNETVFARRFGLCDGQTHRALRLLDPVFLDELNLHFDELSLPVRTIASLPVKEATVFVVENNLNLLTLPVFPRGIAIRGEGNAVNRLARIEWLQKCRLIYWGDIDVEGFLILSRLRNLFPHVESLLMDGETLHDHRSVAGKGNGTTPAAPGNLTPCESAAFEQCAGENLRLEQERIPQSSVDGPKGFENPCWGKQFGPVTILNVPTGSS